MSNTQTEERGRPVEEAASKVEALASYALAMLEELRSSKIWNLLTK